MKFLIVFVSLAVFAKAVDDEFKQKIMEKIHEAGAKCIEEVHPSDDDVADLLAHKVPPVTHEGKCMIFCMHKAFEMMTEDGKLNKEGGLKTLEPLKTADADLYEKSVKVLDTCITSTEVDDDPCITSTNYLMCGVKEGKAMGISEDMFEL